MCDYPEQSGLGSSRRPHSGVGSGFTLNSASAYWVHVSDNDFQADRVFISILRFRPYTFRNSPSTRIYCRLISVTKNVYCILMSCLRGMCAQNPASPFYYQNDAPHNILQQTAFPLFLCCACYGVASIDANCFPHCEIAEERNTSLPNDRSYVCKALMFRVAFTTMSYRVQTYMLQAYCPRASAGVLLNKRPQFIIGQRKKGCNL